MKTQYLFRAYSLLNKEWSEFYIGELYAHEYFMAAEMGSGFDKDSFTMYSGIDDSDGKKIFEGDVACINSLTALNMKCIVTFTDGRFAAILRFKNDISYDREYSLKYATGAPFRIQVIGNIYEGKYKGWNGYEELPEWKE